MLYEGLVVTKAEAYVQTVYKTHLSPVYALIIPVHSLSFLVLLRGRVEDMIASRQLRRQVVAEWRARTCTVAGAASCGLRVLKVVDQAGEDESCKKAVSELKMIHLSIWVRKRFRGLRASTSVSFRRLSRGVSGKSLGQSWWVRGCSRHLQAGVGRCGLWQAVR